LIPPDPDEPERDVVAIIEVQIKTKEGFELSVVGKSLWATD
jgi:hypothetical protein